MKTNKELLEAAANSNKLVEVKAAILQNDIISVPQIYWEGEPDEPIKWEI